MVNYQTIRIENQMFERKAVGMHSKYDALKLDSQLCFPLYACSRKIVKMYHPYLAELGLTYTQYITMLVLWERQKISAKELGTKLYLDSGTLTPVLKSLEKKGLIGRYRSEEDERVLLVELTEEGLALRERALKIPYQLKARLNLDHEEAYQLYQMLGRLLQENPME